MVAISGATRPFERERTVLVSDASAFNVAIWRASPRQSSPVAEASPKAARGVLARRALRRARRTSRGTRTALRLRRGSTDRCRDSCAPAGSPTEVDRRDGVGAVRGSGRRAGGLGRCRRRRSVGFSHRQPRRAARDSRRPDPSRAACRCAARSSRPAVVAAGTGVSR